MKFQEVHARDARRVRNPMRPQPTRNHIAKISPPSHRFETTCRKRWPRPPWPASSPSYHRRKPLACRRFCKPQAIRTLGSPGTSPPFSPLWYRSVQHQTSLSLLKKFTIVSHAATLLARGCVRSTLPSCRRGHRAVPAPSASRPSSPHPRVAAATPGPEGGCSKKT